MNRHARRGLMVVVGAVILPATATAQNPQGRGRGAAQAGQVQTELVVRREVFSYPAFSRRNPFLPVRSVERGEVSAAELRLIGVIIDADPARSVALVGNGRVAPAADGSGMVVSQPATVTEYMRVGESIGNITLREIHEDRIVVDVEQFGLVDRLTIMLETGIGGGTP